MDNRKDDQYYLDKIKENIDFIIKNMENTDYEFFTKTSILQDSMMFRLIQISENSNHISEEYKMTNSSIPWKDISGLRNRIVHDYGNVDLKKVFQTLKTDIPNLKKLIF